MYVTAPPDRSAIDRYVRELQELVGHLPPFDTTDCERLFLRAVQNLPGSPSPVAHWTIRGLTVTALKHIGGVHAADLPDWNSRLQQVWLSASTADLRGAVERLLSTLHDRDNGTAMDPRTATALAHMRAHLHNPALSLDDVSAAVRLSRWYLGRLLRRDTGCAYRRLLREMRVARATELLRDPCLSVKEVAGAAGYRYSTELDRDFKRSLGVTPTVWRKHFLRGGTTPAVSAPLTRTATNRPTARSSLSTSRSPDRATRSRTGASRSRRHPS